MKKPEIKINFLYYETPFDLNKNFFIKLLRKKYKIIFSDKPDYVFFSVYKKNNKFLNSDGSERKKTEIKKSNYFKKLLLKIYNKNSVKEFVWFLREKKIMRHYAQIPNVEGNFIKIFYTSENVKPDMSKCDWAFASCYEEKIKSKRYMRIPSYIMTVEKFNLIKKKINFKKIKKQKIKFCNFLYNNPVHFRNKFFKILNKYKHIDSPGVCMKNMPSHVPNKNAHETRALINWRKNKLNFISKYKFTIAFENSSSNGWITEKLIDPMLVNSVPIYFGAKDVGREFNTKSFINFHNFKNMKEFINYIKKVDKDASLYEEILKEPWLKENKPNLWMDEKRILKKFEEIFKK